DNYSEREPPKENAAGWIYLALKVLDAQKQAAIPAYSPITGTALIPTKGRRPLVVYRSYLGLCAADAQLGKLAWMTECRWSLETMLESARTIQAISQWKQQLQQMGRPEIVLENSIIGTLSTDGERVYCVDDFVVPPLLPRWTDRDESGQLKFPWVEEVNTA